MSMSASPDPKFGRRLRVAGVSFEDRQNLSGHRSGRIASHCSATEFDGLIEASNELVGEGSRKNPAPVTSRNEAVTNPAGCRWKPSVSLKLAPSATICLCNVRLPS